MPGKRVQIDDETWQALVLLGRDIMKDFQELADEAFADLLKKHHRPVGLRDELRQSLRRAAANDGAPRRDDARRDAAASAGSTAPPATPKRRPAKRSPARRLRPAAAHRN